jgi:hypothetical protein
MVKVSLVTSQARMVSQARVTVRRVRVKVNPQMVNPLTVSLAMSKVIATSLTVVMAIAVRSMTVVVRSSLVTLSRTNWLRCPRVPMQSLIVPQLVSHVSKHFIGGNHAIF